MEDSTKTYKKGLKGIAIFGGLQVYKILLSVITAKVSALFLGPVGTGIYGLISSTLTTTEAVVSCGLGTSAVKDISKAKASGSQDEIAATYSTLNWLVWLTGLVGAIAVLVLAPQLSELTFGNTDYAQWFRILSVTILFNQLTSGQGALLSGLQHYKRIAKLRVISGIAGAVISIIGYYFLQIEGIVPVILLTAVVNLLVSVFVVRGIKIKRSHLSFIAALRQGGPMFKMGISIGLSWTLTSIAGLAIRAYISHLSDVATVGLFTASFSMVNTYLGLVFSSIQSDYYPRLSASTANAGEYRSVMLSEMELLILLLAPLVAILIVFAQPVLAIFYSTKFIAAKVIICWSALSMLIRVPGWAMSIGLISHGKTLLYLKSQLLFIAYQLGINMLGFKLGGLAGLGISYTISQILYSLQNYYLQRKNYGIRLNRTVTNVLLFAIGFTFLLCMVATYANNAILYSVGSIGCIIVGVISFRLLNSRMKFLSYLKNKIRKN